MANVEHAASQYVHEKKFQQFLHLLISYAFVNYAHELVIIINFIDYACTQ